VSRGDQHLSHVRYQGYSQGIGETVAGRHIFLVFYDPRPEYPASFGEGCEQIAALLLGNELIKQVFTMKK
jgi:hypothetical protein